MVYFRQIYSVQYMDFHKVRSQFVLKSIRTQFIVILPIFRSIHTHRIFLLSIHLHLVNSYSFWSIHSQFGQFILTLKLTNLEGNIERKNKKKTPKYNRKEIIHEKFASINFCSL